MIILLKKQGAQIRMLAFLVFMHVLHLSHTAMWVTVTSSHTQKNSSHELCYRNARGFQTWTFFPPFNLSLYYWRFYFFFLVCTRWSYQERNTSVPCSPLPQKQFFSTFLIWEKLEDRDEENNLNWNKVFWFF